MVVCCLLTGETRLLPPEFSLRFPKNNVPYVFLLGLFPMFSLSLIPLFLLRTFLMFFYLALCLSLRLFPMFSTQTVLHLE